IGAISLAARRGIIVKNPVALEQIQLCRTAIYDKTGTLTYGQPVLVNEDTAPGFSADHVLVLAASLERYSKHPLAQAILEAARTRNLAPMEATEICERPGQGLEGVLHDQRVQIVGNRQIPALKAWPSNGKTSEGGLQCFIVIDGRPAARYQFRDAPR